MSLKIDNIGNKNFNPVTGLGPIPVYAEKFNSVKSYVQNDAQDTLTGPGAVSLLTKITWVVTESGDALTIADGFEGQEKFVVMKTNGGDGTLTPTNFAQGSNIKFDAAGECVHLLFTNGNWYHLGGTATIH